MSPVHVAPTLVEAVRALGRDAARGFVFVKADGTERLYTFADIAAEAERRAAKLASVLTKGERVALVIPDGDEFVLSFLGALFAGVVPVPIYPQLTFKNIATYHDTVAHIVQASGAAVVLTTGGTKPYVEPIRERVATLRNVSTIDDFTGTGSVDRAIRPEDLAFLQFTSGSTSRPKGVAVSHGNLAANAEAFMIHGLRRDSQRDKGVSWLPLFHDMGLIGFVVGPLFTAVPCVFLPTASFIRSPRLWLDKIHEHRGTITYAPSFAYALAAKRLRDKDVEGLDLSCLRVAGCGAEPIRTRALNDFATRLAPARFDPRAYLPSYGMAEATLAVTFAPLSGGFRSDTVSPNALAQGEALPPQPSDPPGSVREIVDCGQSFPGHEIAVVDEAGRRLGDRRVGEIVVRGPSITLGYFRDAELTAQTIKPIAPIDDPAGESWLHTGDLGYLVEGRLFVCGRLKDTVIIRGRNYYPNDVEWAVSELAVVRRANVVAFGAEVDGEEQLVVCCEGTASDAAGIQEAARACIAAHFGLTVHEVVVCPPTSLPRTSSGKPQRRKTRQMYLDGTLPRARSVHGGGGAAGLVDPAEGNTPTLGSQTT